MKVNMNDKPNPLVRVKFTLPCVLHQIERKKGEEIYAKYFWPPGQLFPQLKIAKIAPPGGGCHPPETDIYPLKLSHAGYRCGRR